MKTPQIRYPEFTDGWKEDKLINVIETIATGKSKADITNGNYAILGSTDVIGYSDTYDYEGNFILTARVGANAGTLYKHSGKVKRWEVIFLLVYLQMD